MQFKFTSYNIPLNSLPPCQRMFNLKLEFLLMKSVTVFKGNLYQLYIEEINVKQLLLSGVN